jgi:hypothetical protein
MLSENIPQILINRESLGNFNFDVELLGDCDVIVKEISLRLGEDWCSKIQEKELKQLKQIDSENEIKAFLDKCATNPHEDDNKISSIIQGNLFKCLLSEHIFEVGQSRINTLKTFDGTFAFPI